MSENELNLDALRKVAEGAPARELTHYENDLRLHSVIAVPAWDGDDLLTLSLCYREDQVGLPPTEAAFIAAFDPPTVLALLDELRDGRAEVKWVKDSRSFWWERSRDVAKYKLQVEALRAAGDAMAEAVDEQGHYLSAGLSRRCADCDKPSPITTNAWDEHYSDCPVLTRRATLDAWRKARGESA